MLDDGEVNVGPFPNRGDTMYLQTLANERNRPARKSFNLETADIAGARPKEAPRVDGEAGKARPPPEKVERSSPMRLHPTTVNKPSYINVNEDIEGTKPFNKKALKTTRHLNPLEPEYQLPSAPLVVPPEVPQRRVTNQLDDLLLARPRTLIPRTPPRDIMRTDDCVGEPRRPRSSGRDPLNVTDIVNQDFKTSRQVDIMSPRYCYDVPPAVEPESWRIGEIEKNHPRGPRAASPPPYFPLHTADIEGCEPNAALKKAQDELGNGHKRRHFRNTNFLGDIEGSNQAHRRPFSKRHTNPLNPAYKLLDEAARAARTPPAPLPAIVESEAPRAVRPPSNPPARQPQQGAEVMRVEPPAPDIEMHVPDFSIGGGGGGGKPPTPKPPTPAFKPPTPGGAKAATPGGGKPASPAAFKPPTPLGRQTPKTAGAGKPPSRRGSGIVDDLRAEIAAVRNLPDF